MLLSMLLFSVFANVGFAHAQSPSNQANLNTDQTQYQLSLEHTTPVKITGKTNGVRGDRVEITITKPDGTADVSYAFLANTGGFVSIYLLNKNSPTGSYQISVTHEGAVVGSTSFSVTSAQSTSGPSTVTPAQYQLYKNDDYGFSIEYPSNWSLTNHFEEGAAIVGVGFSPDKNLEIDVGIQKDNNPFAGMTDQQSLDSITTMLKNRCSSATIQKTGFTCSQDQYNQNIVNFQGSSGYLVASGLVKTFPDRSSVKWISEWFLIPKGNDVWVMVVETSLDDFNSYSTEITHMGNSLNIYGISQQNVLPNADYSNYGLQKGESISYKYSIAVQSPDAETQQAVTNAMLQSIANQIGNVTLNSIDEVEWMKYTVTDVSQADILFDEEVKVRNYNVIEHQRDMKYLTGTAIPIDAKVGNSYDMFSGGGAGMLQGTVDKITTIKIGNMDVPVFELTGSTRNVSPDGSTVTTMNVTAYYDKKTGIGLKALFDMNVVGQKIVKVHMELNTVQWSGLGTQPAQITAALPGWIKNTAKWWAEGQLDDSDFTKGVQYMIQQGIIQIPVTQTGSSQTQGIPAWVKNTAKWWAEGQLSDADFIKGIQYMVQNGIITAQQGRQDYSGILSGATFYTGKQPAQQIVTYTDKYGITSSGYAIPGQVLLFVVPDSSQETVTRVVTSLNGAVLSGIPQAGYYLIQTSDVKNFITNILQNSIVIDAYPNFALDSDQSLPGSSNSQIINPSYVIDKDPYPNSHVVMAVIDDYAGCGVLAKPPHGCAVLGEIQSTQTTVPILAIQSNRNSNGAFDSNQILENIARAIGYAEKYGKKLVISESIGIRLRDENGNPLQGGNENYFNSINSRINLLAGLDSHAVSKDFVENNVLYYKAAGNDNVDLSQATGKLETQANSLYKTNFSLVGQIDKNTQRPMAYDSIGRSGSNRGSGIIYDDSTSRSCPRGTSCTTPNYASAAAAIWADNPNLKPSAIHDSIRDTATQNSKNGYPVLDPQAAYNSANKCLPLCSQLAYNNPQQNSGTNPQQNLGTSPQQNPSNTPQSQPSSTPSNTLTPKGGSVALGIDLTGRWGGTARGTIVLSSDQLTCSYSANISLNLQQKGTSLSGPVNVSNISLSGEGCQAVGFENIQGSLSAIIFGSGFSGTVDILSVKGQFTQDLMRGTYSGGSGDYSIGGDFTASRR